MASIKKALTPTFSDFLSTELRAICGSVPDGAMTSPFVAYTRFCFPVCQHTHTGVRSNYAMKTHPASQVRPNRPGAVRSQRAQRTPLAAARATAPAAHLRWAASSNPGSAQLCNNRNSTRANSCARRTTLRPVVKRPHRPSTSAANKPREMAFISALFILNTERARKRKSFCSLCVIIS